MDKIRKPSIPDLFVNLEAKQSFTEKCLNNDTPKKKKKLKKISSKIGTVQVAETKNVGYEKNHHSPSRENSSTVHKKPLLYCRFIARFPLCSLFLTSIFHVSVIVATVSLVVTGHDVFPIDFETMPLFLHTDNTRTQDLAWRDKDDYSGKVWRPVSGISQPSYYNGYVGDLVEVIMEVPNYDIFSRTNLLLIQEAEEIMFNLKFYQLFYCYVGSGSGCEKPSSVLRLFDGTFNSSSSVFYDPTFSNIHNVLCESLNYNETKDYVKYFLEVGLDPCDGILKTSKTRFFFKIGWPLRGVNDKNRLEGYLVSYVKPRLEDIRDGIFADKITLYYISTLLFKHDIVIQAMNDMMLAIGSFLFIFAFMWIQTASFWITFMGIFSILTSFLMTNLIYRFLLGYKYFGFFHIISMFIILGIGADDVFIFYDTWRLTGHTIYPSKAHRLSDCYRKAAKTTFVTSLTTMVAFLVSGLSPLLPVCSFGLFSGILVFVNYLCDLLYFPTVIMVYSQKIKPLWDKVCDPCKQKCCKKKNRRDKDGEPDLLKNAAPVATRNLTWGSTDDVKGFTSRPASRESSETDISDMTPRTKRNFEDRNRIVVFLKNGFYDFMTLRAVRIIIPIIFVGVSIFFIWSASRLEPDSQHLQLYRASHNYGKASRMHYYSFQRSFEDEYTIVYLSWGILPKDLSGCDLKSKTYCTGDPSWDDTFDPNTHDAQTALKNLCTRLKTMSDAEATSLKIKRDAITNELEIACFTDAMESYLQSVITANGTTFPSGLNMNMPLDAGNVTDFMDAQPSIYDSSALPSDFSHYLGIGLSYWLSNSYTSQATDDYYLYNGLIGEQAVYGTTQQSQNSFNMYYGTKVRYIGIQINTTLNVYKLGFPEGKPVYERWEQLMTDELAKMPSSMKNGFQSTKNTWHWIKVQESLSESAIHGVIIGLCLALPILIFTTLNVVIGFLATVIIALVTACVIGIIPLMDWRLGVLESLNMCMVVGLSVDYVVHLAEAYGTCPSPYRPDRVRSMLESMGLSVVSGALTTFGAASFMLFSQIQFIYQFGIFVMCTISTSLVFSLFCFTTFMSIFGPQGNTGSLRSFGKWLKSNCCYCCDGDKNSSEAIVGPGKSCLIACVLCHCTSLDNLVTDSLIPIEETRHRKHRRKRLKKAH